METTEKIVESYCRYVKGWLIFIQRKIGPKEVLSELEKYGFKRGNYTKVIVTWGLTAEAKEEADREDIILWDFRDILKESFAYPQNVR